MSGQGAAGGPFGGFLRDLRATLRGSVDGVRESRPKSEHPPGLVGAFSNAAHRGNQTLRVFEDRVEVSTQNVLSADSQSVRYDRLAGVSRRAGLSGYSTVVIETTGGARLVVKGLPNARAAAAIDLIGSRRIDTRQPTSDVQFM